MSATLPDTVARGIINLSKMTSDGHPSPGLFKDFAESENRSDGYKELSVNWCDCQEAIDHLLRQEREGRPTYSCGVAILSRSEIDGLRRRPIVRNLLSYERKEIDGNKYHGNLLLHNSASKNARDIIANGLLLCVEEVVPQDA